MKNLAWPAGTHHLLNDPLLSREVSFLGLACVGRVLLHASMQDLRMGCNMCFMYTWALLIFCANFEEKKFTQGFICVWKEVCVSDWELI